MQEQLQAVDALLRQHRVKKAEILLAKLLRSLTSPQEQGTAMIYRARTRLLNGRPEAAIDDLLKVRLLAPQAYETVMAQELLADCFFARFELSSVGFADRNDAHQAQVIYRRIIDTEPGYDNLGWVYYQSGRVFLSENRVEEAAGCFQQALLSPSHVPALTAYCYERLGFMAFYEQRDSARALAFLNKAIDTYPIKEERAWLVQIYILRCRVLREIGQVDAALQSAEKALELASGGLRTGLAEALLARAELLVGVERRERDVIATLEQFRAVSRRPLGVDVTWARVHEMLGDAYSATGRYEDAVIAYRAVLQYNPYHPWEVSIYYRVGRAYYQLGQYERAVTTLEHAIRSAESEGHPHDYRLYDACGNAYFALGQYGKAAMAYENALKSAHSANVDRIRQYYQFSLNLMNQSVNG